MTNITLLDGSIGQEIVKRSGSRATPLWSTSVMMEQPEAVRAVHLDYFNAGATIATANTYAVHVDRLARVGLEAQHKTLLDIAMAEAVAARTAHGSGRIAASLGPLGASYRPDIAPPLAEAQKAYASIVEALDPLADLFLIETVSSSTTHAARSWAAPPQKNPSGSPLQLMMMTEPSSAPANLSLTLPRSSPSSLPPPSSSTAPAPKPSLQRSISSRPWACPSAPMPMASRASPKAFLKDAPTVDALEQRKDLGPKDYAAFVMHWIAQGATIVGGCCEVGPEHITELANQLKAAGHTII